MIARIQAWWRRLRERRLVRASLTDAMAAIVKQAGSDANGWSIVLPYDYVRQLLGRLQQVDVVEQKLRDALARLNGHEIRLRRAEDEVQGIRGAMELRGRASRN